MQKKREKKRTEKISEDIAEIHHFLFLTFFANSFCKIMPIFMKDKSVETLLYSTQFADYKTVKIL